MGRAETLAPQHRREKWIVRGLALALALGWLVSILWADSGESSSPASAPVSAVKPANVSIGLDPECAAAGAKVTALSDRLDAAFGRHAQAHHDYVAKKLAFGDPKNIKPNTVLWIWRETLKERERVTPAYHQARDTWRSDCA